MGMYTEFRVCCRLKRDTPSSVIEILKWLSKGDQILGEPPPLPAHPLFECERWPSLFTMGSAYFDDRPSSAVVKFGENWHVLTVANLKNYSDEIGKFIDWLSPFVDAAPGEVWARHRYEEFDDETLVAA
jgi:hypothetical protein